MEENVVEMVFLFPHLELSTSDKRQDNVHASIGGYESTNLDWLKDHSLDECFGITRKTRLCYRPLYNR